MKTKIVNNNDIYYPNKLWWFEESNEDSFSIFDLNSLYDTKYFSNDHLGDDVCNKIVDMSKDVFKLNSNKELQTVLECGSGGGWITQRFKDANIEIEGIEGSPSGHNKCVSRGLDCVIKHDLRTPINLGKTFDMVLSTEVAEHIEPPFVGVYVKNLIDHGDIIWFSFNHESPHSNHHNCMPEKYWVNVFGFYGFEYYRASSEYKNSLSHRLNGFFYNPKIYSEFKM